MTLSKTVIESLNEASSHVRNALSYASRSERPVIVKKLSEILFEIENIESTDDLFDTLDSIGGDLSSNEE